MHSKLLRVVVSAGALMVAALPVAAHHSFSAEFDQNKQVTLEGKVVQMEWVNPHAWLTIDVPDTAGKADRWQLEFGPPNQLFRRGWRKTSLMPGMKVTATGFLAKDGRKVANADKVTLPNGKVFGAGVNEGGPETAHK